MVKRATPAAKTAKGTAVSLRSPVTKAKPTNAEQLTPAQVEGRRKAAEQRQLSSHKTKAAAGFESLGGVTQHDEIDFIEGWLRARPHLIPWVASLMRNGHLEKSYSSQMETAEVNNSLSTWGKKVVREPGMKFRNLSGRAAVSFLQFLCPKYGFNDMFNGKDGPGIHLANKTLQYILGVQGSAPLPVRHPQCTHEIPLRQGFALRLQQIGNRLPASLTPDALDTATDYWQLHEEPWQVTSTVSRKPVPISLDMSAASDWCIMLPESYSEGELVSEALGVQLKLFRAYEVKFERPEFDGAFDFPQKSDMSADMLALYDAHNSGGASASASSPAPPGASAIAKRAVSRPVPATVSAPRGAT